MVDVFVECGSYVGDIRAGRLFLVVTIVRVYQFDSIGLLLVINFLHSSKSKRRDV